MDWKLTINRNREALAAIVAGLVPLAAAAQEVPHPRLLCRFISRILRPAESALRRLIVVVAAVLAENASAKATASETGPVAKTLPDFSAFARGNGLGCFRLDDPPRRTCVESAGRVRVPPRISVPGIFDRAARLEPAVDTHSILRRIERLEFALKSLPRQARRLNRLMARRASGPGSKTTSPLRRGHPPGHRKRPRHPVDDILRDCHFLARDCGFKPP